MKTALIFFKCLNAYLKTFCILLLLLLAFIILIQILVYWNLQIQLISILWFCFIVSRISNYFLQSCCSQMSAEEEAVDYQSRKESRRIAKYEFTIAGLWTILWKCRIFYNNMLPEMKNTLVSYCFFSTKLQTLNEILLYRHKLAYKHMHKHILMCLFTRTKDFYFLLLWNYISR